jgi:multidrug efflux pump subunit AcrA (membrane-fusion protein)
MKTAAALVVALLSLACTSGYSDEPPPEALRVRRGAFAGDVLLSGELEAARGDFLAVPELPSWQTAIKWLAEDGAAVKGGEPVVELDNTSLTADLETKRQTAMQLVQQRAQNEAEWQADLEQKQLDTDKKRSDLDKARIEAAVPKDIVSARSYEEKQTALRRAATEYDKAVDVLASRRTRHRGGAPQSRPAARESAARHLHRRARDHRAGAARSSGRHRGGARPSVGGAQVPDG